MKIEDWKEALDGWQKFHAQMKIDIEKTEFYINMLEKKIADIEQEDKNGK